MRHFTADGVVKQFSTNKLSTARQDFIRRSKRWLILTEILEMVERTLSIDLVQTCWGRADNDWWIDDTMKVLNRTIAYLMLDKVRSWGVMKVIVTNECNYLSIYTNYSVIDNTPLDTMFPVLTMSTISQLTASSTHLLILLILKSWRP